MCLAIYKPSGVAADWDALENGFNNNKDGAGFAVAKNDTLDIYKGFFTFDQFKEAFAQFSNDQAIIHFRLATHGAKDAKNCHPFLIRSNLALIHNGILNISCDTDKGMSDTWHYVHHILTPLAESDIDFYSRPEIRFLGESAIGTNKFVFLRADGDWMIWNDSDGYWEGDVWYSNRSHTYAYGRTLIRGFGTDKATSLLVRDSLRDSLNDRTDIEVYDDDTIWDPENSTVYDDLTDRDQQAYDALLQEGFDVDYLDDLIECHGANVLYEMVNRNSYEGGL